MPVYTLMLRLWEKGTFILRGWRAWGLSILLLTALQTDDIVINFGMGMPLQHNSANTQPKQSHLNYNNFKLIQSLHKNLQIEPTMQPQKLNLILAGTPCSLTQTQIMQLGAKCSSEGYSLDKLIHIAKTLFKSDSESCFRFLEYVEKHEITRNIYKDFVHQPGKIQIYYSLAALSLTKALKQNDKPAIEKWQKEFNKYLNLGTGVKTSVQKMYQLLHGFNSYYAGDFSKAMANFNALDQVDRKENLSTIALLGLAQSNFMIKKYDRALEYYKKALISNRNLPTKARLGMAYCFYQLEKYELAEKCFQRIIALDAGSAEAYIGLAVINYKNNKVDKYFSLLKEAYRLKPNDPLIILHLSEHFLMVGELQKCYKMSTKGLQSLESMPKFFKKEATYRDDYQILKAKFNNLIGQVHHAKSQFEQARKYYQLAKDRGLKYNDIALAQTLTQNGTFKDALKILQTIFTTTKPAQLKLFSQSYKTLAYLQIKSQTKIGNEETGPSNYYKQALKYHKNDYDALIEYSVHLHDTNDKKQTLKILQSALKAVQATGKEPKAELLNNIGVSLIEDKAIDEAETIFDKALRILQGYPQSGPEQLLRYHALYLTISFNKASVLQMKHKFEQAIHIHHNLIKYNKFYVDSYVKLGDILHSLGQKAAAFEILDTGINECLKVKHQEVRVDKLYSLKGHLQHSDGNISQAKQSLKKLGKSIVPYDQLYQLCIGYEIVIRKQVQKVVLKDFLRPNRQSVIDICRNDPYNVFSYMVLTILFLTDNKITKEQGTQYFNQLKIAEQDFPEIQYNFGVFSLINQQYENALFCFNRFKEKTRSTAADQYIALTYFLKGDYVECLNVIKKGILNQPNNLKLRFQYAYANEKRVQKLYEEEEKNFKDLKLSSKYLTTCKKIHEAISKYATLDYIKTVATPELKQKMKNQIIKLRSASQDRERFVQSQLEHYRQRQKYIVQKERKLREEEQEKLEQLRRVKEKQKLFEELGEDEDESESQKQRKQRRKKLMELSLRQTEEANQQWKIAQEKEKQKAELGEETKKKRRNNNQGGKKTKKEKKNNPQEKVEEEYQSEDQFKDENLSEDEPIEYEEQQLERRKRKEKKRKNKERQREKEKGSGGSDEDKKKRKKKKKQRKQQEQKDELRKQEGQNEQIQSEKGSNPFDEDGDEIKEQGQNEIKDRQEAHKKKKKPKKDDDEIDLNDFLIQ